MADPEKPKRPAPPDRKDNISLAGVSPEDALAAFMKVDPKKVERAELKRTAKRGSGARRTGRCYVVRAKSDP